MNPHPFIALIVLSVATHGFSEPPAPTKEQVIALMNKVQERVAGGDISALDDLLALPGNWAVPALLDIFEEHNNPAEANERAMAARAAELATSVAGGEKYLIMTMKDNPDDSPPWVFGQQDTAIRCLIFARNNTAVRVLCSALDQPQMGGRVANALANMNLPGAPYSSIHKDDTSSAAGIAQWKQWWKTNASHYAKNSDSKPIASPSP
jgi:hypothetical protein